MAEMMQTVSPAEGKERQVHAGFAKLRGRGWEFFMQKYEIVLGRHSKNSAVDIDLAKDGGGMNVSRRHARIYYNFDTTRFELEVLGKNGATVDGQLKVPSDGPVPLESQTLVVIGDFPFYFLLPTKKIEKRRPMEQNQGVKSYGTSELENPLASMKITASFQDGIHSRAIQNGTVASHGANGAYEMETESGGADAGEETKLDDEIDETLKVEERQPEESDYEVAAEPKQSDLEGGQATEKKGGVKKESVRNGGRRSGAKEPAEDGLEADGEPVGCAGLPPGDDTIKEEQHSLDPQMNSVGPSLDLDAADRKPLRRGKREPETSEGFPQTDRPVVGGRRKRESEVEVEEPGPSASQRKAARKKESSNRDGSPEPAFQARNLRVASPPRQKWPGDGDTKPPRVAPSSPTRAGTKRAAVEAAAVADQTRGGRKMGESEDGTGMAPEVELVDAVASILGGQDDPKAAVPLNRLFMLLSERHRELYNRSRNLLTAAAEGDASEQLHRPWLALASFLKRYPQHFVVESQAKGRLVSWYAALRHA